MYESFPDLCPVCRKNVKGLINNVECLKCQTFYCSDDCFQKDKKDHVTSCVRLTKEQAEKFYKMVGIAKGISYRGDELLAMPGPISGPLPPTMVATSDLANFVKEVPAITPALQSKFFYMVKESQFFRTFKYLLTPEQLEEQIAVKTQYIMLKK